MSTNEEKQRLLSSAFIIAGIIGILWLVKSIELIFGISFARLGILPLQAEGLKGIIFAPFIHGSIQHLVSNSVPLFLLGAALFYYYRSKAWLILILSWLLTGFWVWLFARGSAYHIGASGVVYALTAFHFVSGIIRKEPRLIAFSLLITFLYGSFIWGIFPGFAIKERISWESHLMGTIAGVVLAYAFRDFGPQRKVYQWPEDDDEEDESGETAKDLMWKTEEEYGQGTNDLTEERIEKITEEKVEDLTQAKTDDLTKERIDKKIKEQTEKGGEEITDNIVVRYIIKDKSSDTTSDEMKDKVRFQVRTKERNDNIDGPEDHKLPN